jgi:hypothetical protein
MKWYDQEILTLTHLVASNASLSSLSQSSADSSFNLKSEQHGTNDMCNHSGRIQDASGNM